MMGLPVIRSRPRSARRAQRGGAARGAGGGLGADNVL